MGKHVRVKATGQAPLPRTPEIDRPALRVAGCGLGSDEACDVCSLPRQHPRKGQALDEQRSSLACHCDDW
jgi:hypothetical protein